MSKFKISDSTTCSVRKKVKEQDNTMFNGYVKVVCRDADGNVKWEDEGKNLVVDTGIDYILGTAILDSATLYLGLTTGTPAPAAGWTMTNASGVEAAGYSAGTRPGWTQGAVSAQTVTNGTPVTFTMDGTDTTIGGAFLTTDSTKDGTAGTLIALKAFDTDKTVANLDTLDVTYTIVGS